jgi:glycosyltransferase involved in cell wall biosynthesis
VSARLPRVSVLLPVKDAASTLPACLRSLRGQTLAEHEVVAVDDGSKDGSADLLERAAAEDDRLVLARAPAPGLVPALNAALLRARAPLLARMDADDVAHPERLRLQAEALERDPGLAILGSRVEVLGGEGNEGMRAYVAWSNGLLHDLQIQRDLLVESPLVHPSVALRASALRDLGGYRAYDGPEDYDLWLRAAARGLRFAKRPEVLLQWRDSGDRLTRTDPRYGRERFFSRKLEALLAGRLAPGEAVVIWGAGVVGKAWARALRQRGVALSAFVEVDARKLGQRIHGAPVVEVAAAGGFKDALHLAAVGQRGARERIRACARHHGIVEERLLAVA